MEVHMYIHNTRFHAQMTSILEPTGEKQFDCFSQGIMSSSHECMGCLEPVVSNEIMLSRVRIITKYTFPHTGRHNCLWCLATQADLIAPLHQRGRLPSRTVQLMEADYQWFSAAGGNLKNAKLFNNSIGEPILKIPIDKVCKPTLPP